MNIFEYAVRNKLRFQSTRGALTVEQLWDLPLTSKDTFNLDTVAKEINRFLKEQKEESFVQVKSDNETEAEIMLEIVKHIIAVKLNEANAAVEREQKRRERQRILEILAHKEDTELSNMSKEELVAKLEQLG